MKVLEKQKVFNFLLIIKKDSNLRTCLIGQGGQEETGGTHTGWEEGVDCYQFPICCGIGIPL